MTSLLRNTRSLAGCYDCLCGSVHRGLTGFRHWLILALVSGLLAVPALAAEPAAPLSGSWEGPLVIGRDNMNLAFTFRQQDGEFSAALTSGGMGIYGMPAEAVEVDGLSLKISMPRLDAEFTGTLRLDDAGETVMRIDGDWFQYAEMVPVVLRPVDEPSF